MLHLIDAIHQLGPRITHTNLMIATFFDNDVDVLIDRRAEDTPLFGFGERRKVRASSEEAES